MQTGTENRPCDYSKDYFGGISWEIGEYAYGQRCSEGDLHLEGKPCGSEEVGDGGWKSHAYHD